MGQSEDAERIVAACADCEAVYTAFRWPDGTVAPIGNARACRCGGTEFVDLTARTDDWPPDPGDVTEST